MREYITLGTAPVGEDCVQVSDKEDYIDKMRSECQSFMELLHSMFPKFPVQFGIKSFPHDFGTYLEVVVYYDDNEEEQVDAAYFIESNLPITWKDDKVYTMQDVKNSF